MTESFDDDMAQLEKELEKELQERQRGEGGETNAITGDNVARMGVLLKLLTAVQEEKEYRQALLTADFIDDEEADRVAAAVAEANRYGLSLAPIMDWCATRCAVNRSGHGKSRSVLSIEGLTHSTFTSLRYGKDRFTGNQKKQLEQE